MISNKERGKLPGSGEVYNPKKAVQDAIRTLDVIPRFPFLKRNPWTYGFVYDDIPAILVLEREEKGQREGVFADLSGLYSVRLERHLQPGNEESSIYMTGERQDLTAEEYMRYVGIAKSKIYDEVIRQKTVNGEKTEEAAEKVKKKLVSSPRSILPTSVFNKDLERRRSKYQQASNALQESKASLKAD